MKRRAERQDETRRRIVEAAIELHQTIGPAATTVTDIAERANVGRVTFYRHFADVDELAHACSGLYFEQHPAPDPDSWLEIDDPDERVRAAVVQTYAYHRATEKMIGHALADARDHEVMKPYHELWRHACDVLMKGRRARGRNRIRLRAALSVVLSFDTWRTLVREHGLSEADAVEVALRMATPNRPAL